MATRDDLTIDQYAPLAHKTLFSHGGRSLAPTWVPPDQRRRLDAYRILAAYRSNVARWFLPDLDPTAANRREYGDAELIVERVVAGVLGDELAIVVDGANDELPDEPPLPDRPDDPTQLDAETDEITRRVAQLRHDRWLEQANAIVDEWDAAWRAQPALRDRQEWLRQWADDEHLAAKLVEGEGDTVGLGDGVYVLTWSNAKRRPRLEVVDPGFYFPVIDEATEPGEFPRKVHLAWEFVDDQGDTWVRRRTWELVDVGQAIAARLDPSSADLAADYAAAVQAAPGVEVFTDDNGIRRVGRRYPWQAAGDKPSTTTCLFSDARWRLSDAGKPLHDLDPTKAVWETTEDGDVARDVDLRIDFVPVVHVPNTPASRLHFGAAVLLLVAQILDELSASDTDVCAAGALAALPVIALADEVGSTNKDRTVASGTVWKLGPNGRMDVLDLSTALPELRRNVDALLDRLSVNGKVPSELVGRTPDGADALSGISRLVKLGPFRQLVEHLRLTRTPKDALLLKFVQRLAQVGEVLDPGELPHAEIVRGSYLPHDLSGVIADVASLLTAHAISRQTGLAMLVDAGLSIEDAAAELDRISAEDTEGARNVADATGSELLAADRLGLDLPEAAASPAQGPPVIGLTGTTGAENDQGGEGAGA